MPSTFHLIGGGGIQPLYRLQVNNFAYSMASLVFKLEQELKNNTYIIVVIGNKV